MSFITSPGVIVPPLTAGGVAYGTGSQAKMNSAGTVGQVLTSAGAGVPTWATPASVSYPITVPLGGTGLTTLTANNVILGNGASAPTFVAPGTSGNVLQSNGTTWASAAASSGALTFISSVLAASATTVDIENAFTDYQTYLIIGSEITTTSDFNVRFKIGGSYLTANYYNFGVGGYNGLATPSLQQGDNVSEMFIFGNGFSTVANFYLTIGVKSGKKTFINFSVNGDTIGKVGIQNGAGNNSSTGALEGVRIFGSTYTGTFRLYGVSNS